MAHHQSAIKRIRQNKKRNLRNRSLQSRMRGEMKKFRELLKSGSSEQAQAQLPNIYKALDKAVTKGILHRKNAARKKSRFAIAVNQKNIAAA